MMKSRTKLTTLILSVIMTLVLCIGLVPMFATTASAATAETPTYDEKYLRIEGRGTPLLIEAGTEGGTAVSYMNGSTKTYVNQSGAKGDDLSSWRIYGGAHTVPSGTFYTEGFITMTGGSVGGIFAGNYSDSTAFMGSVRLIITGGSVGEIFLPEPRTVPVTMVFVTIQDANGTNEIWSKDGRLQNGIYKNGSEYVVVGNAEVPAGFSLTIAEGESLTVDSGEVLNNNGTITNNGTVAVNGTLNNNATFNNNGTIAMNAPMGSGESTISGNSIVRNAMYIETASTGATPTVYVNGTEVSGVSTEYINGKLYIYPLQTGNVKAVLNGTTYYGIINSTSGEHALSSTNNKVTDIQFSLTQMQAGKMVDLAGYTKLSPSSTTYPTTVSYEILSGTTANNASLDGSKLLAGAGTVQLKITAKDAFSEYSETFTITVPASDTIDVGSGPVVIEQKDSNTYTVTWQGFEGGSKDYSADTPIVITGTTDTHNITVNSGEPNLVLQDVNIQANNPFDIASGAKVNLVLFGDNVLTANSSSTCAGLHVPSGAEVIINGDGKLTVTAGKFSAGIGGAEDEGAGNITINGGTVIANSSILNAVGGAGIGGGMNGDGGTVTITGGNIKAYSYWGQAIGNGFNGSGVTVTNGTSPVSLVTVTLMDMSTLEAVSAGVKVTDTDLSVEYGLSGVYTMDGGKLYLYLPSDTELTSITLENGSTYIGKLNASRVIFGTNIDESNKPSVDANGAYLISNIDEWNWFSKYALVYNEICGKLTANLDATGSDFRSIGTSDYMYAGTFDGNGKTLTVALSGEGSVAPFGYLNGATIRNLCVAGSINVSGQYAAGIASHTYGNTLIENCIVSVEITSTVRGDGTHGGLVGVAEEGCSLTINNCAFIGSIKGGNTTNCGGFVGWSATACTIKNSYMAGTFTASTSGSNTFARNNHTLENCYYLNTFGDVSENATQKDEKAFASGEVAWLLNGESSDGIWKQSIGTNGYPNFTGAIVYKVSCAEAFIYSNKNIHYNTHKLVGDVCTRCGTNVNTPKTDENGTYLIYTAENLKCFADIVNGGNSSANAKLMANIDMSAYQNITIGSSSVKYGGTFDGNGKTITLALSGGNRTALISYADGATVKNLTIDGTLKTSGQYSGSFIGEAVSGNVTIENCISKVTLTFTNSGDGTNGGFVGLNNATSLIIKNSAFIGKFISEKSYNNGGLVGWSKNSCTIENCYVAADFTGHTTTDGCETFSRNPDMVTVTNSYYLNPLGGVDEGILADEAQFESGYVAYKLNDTNAGTDSAVWKQTLGTDNYPSFTGGVVYAVTCVDIPCYCNDKDVSYDAHDFTEKGFCKVCGSYQPAGGSGTVSDPYTISNAGQLYWFAELVNGGANTANTANAVLTADIDLENRPWTPIGTYSDSEQANNAPYQGIFDGQNHVIKNLNVKIETTHEAGLFGRVNNGAALKNFGVINAYVENTQGIRVGVIAGEIHQSTVTNVFSAGTITLVSNNDNGELGGIAGECAESALTNCFTTYNYLTSNARTLINCYYMASEETDGSVGSYLPQSTFESGELAYLLNGNSSEGVWKQTLGTDHYPSFTGSVVYKTACSSGVKYNNDKDSSLDAHSFTVEGFCEICDAYQPATLVTAEKLDELKLDEAYLGYYAIGNAGQLYWFAALTNGTLTDGTAQNASANAILLNDITVNENVFDEDGKLVSDTSSLRAWIPISDFNNNGRQAYAGIFDGRGCIISGLYCNRNEIYAALVGGSNASTLVVKNVTVANSYFSATQYAAGIAGYCIGNIENCASVGCVITTTDGRAGGIVAAITGGSINNCYNTSSVSGTERVGGICGALQYDGTITNCYNTGKVTADRYYGGICFITTDAGDIKVENCYDNGDVNSVLITNNGNQGTVTNVVSKTTAQFENGEVAWLLNGESGEGIWKQNLGADASPGFTGNTVYKATCGDVTFFSNESISNTSHDYDDNVCTVCGNHVFDKDDNGNYLIHNANDLKVFADLVNAGNTSASAKLMANIDMSAYPSFTIGSNSAKYGGTFDGNGYTLTLALNGGENTALFGYLNGATIKNLHVAGTITASDKYASGIAAHTYGNTVIENCISSIVITSTLTGSSLVDGTHAGFVGVAEDGTLTINNCAFIGAINGTGTKSCGGFVGWTNATTTIKNSYVAATFTVSADESNTFARSTNYTLTNCYYLNALGGVSSGATQMSEAAFASGEVAYLLGEAWGQTLNGDNKDAYPVLGGEATPAENFIIIGQQLNLGADLSMKYYVYGYKYVNGEKEELKLDLFEMQFTFLGEITYVNGVFDENTGTYVFVLDGINPQCLGNKIDAVVYYDKVRTDAEKLDYSVEDNLNNLLEKYADDEKLVALINDILAYGEAAEAYAGYESTPDTNYSDNGSGREIPKAEYAWTGDYAGDYIHAFAIRFGTMNNVKIQLEQALDGKSLTFDYADFTADPQASLVYVSDGIAASDFDEDIVLCIMDGYTAAEVLTVSVNDLLYLAYQSYSSVDSSHAEYEKYQNLAALTQALYNYGASAEAYVASLAG